MNTSKYNGKDYEAQKMYLYDYYIQINVSSVNGFRLTKHDHDNNLDSNMFNSSELNKTRQRRQTTAPSQISDK